MTDLLNFLQAIIFACFIIGICSPKVFTFIIPNPTRVKTSLLFVAIIILIAIASSCIQKSPICRVIYNEPETQQKTEISQPTNTESMRAIYDKIKVGMTISQVTKIAGEPSNHNEMEMAGLGKTENFHYQPGDGLTAFDVNFLNGRVSLKTWVQL